MQKMTVSEIAEATGGRLLCGDGSREISGISTNSGETVAGDLFVPLPGVKFDGHEFIQAAFDLGAAAVLTHKPTEPFVDKTIVRVGDTTKALGDIARYYMKKCAIPRIAITGSVGKTTTKDMVASVLSKKYSTHKTWKNFNNHIGVPKTIFGIESYHEMAVIEMGMNHFGEIDYLASIAQPEAAIITNIGESHIENLGSREGIFKAKMEITNRFGKDNTLIVNGDDDFLCHVKGMGEYKTVYFGISNPENDVYAKNIQNKGLDGVSFTLAADGAEYDAQITVPGRHNVYNALAAVCAGIYAGVPMDDILDGIRSFESSGMRLEIVEHNGVVIINDCYNASPDSIRSAFEVLKDTAAKRTIAVLGDVMEMGDYAPKAHYDLGKYAALSCDVLITAGENMKELARGAGEKKDIEIHAFDKTLEVCDFINGFVREGDAVLIKASHGMHFDEVYDALTRG